VYYAKNYDFCDKFYAITFWPSHFGHHIYGTCLEMKKVYKRMP